MYLLANHLLGGRRRKRGGGGNKVRVLVIAICLLTAPSLLVRGENLAEQKLRKQGPPNDVDAREAAQREDGNRNVDNTMSNTTSGDNSGPSSDDIAVIGVIGTFISIFVAIIGIIVLIIGYHRRCRRSDPAGEVHEPVTAVNPFANFEEAEAEKHKLEEKFKELSNETRNMLEGNAVSVDQFNEVISGIPVSLKIDQIKFFSKTLPKLRRSASLHHAFGILNMYFLNYELLDYIIDKFGNESIKKKMDTYKQELRWFRKKTPIQLFLLLCGKNPRDYDCNCYKQVVFHLPSFWIDYRLEDEHQLRHSFASRFYLNTTPLLLHHMSSGSVVITWLVPVSISQDLSEDIQQDDTGFMSEQQALQVTVDGTVVYEQPPKTPSDFAVFKSKPDPEELREWVVSKINDDQEVREGIIATFGGPPVNVYFDPRRHSLVDALNIWRTTPRDKSWVDLVESLLQEHLKDRTQMVVNNLYDHLLYKYQ